jgi:hypothetical protein
MFVFGLLVWFYVILIEVTHLDWLSDPLSHIDFPPFNWRVDVTGMIAFVVAPLGFFVWRLKERERSEQLRLKLGLWISARYSLSDPDNVRPGRF